MEMLVEVAYSVGATLMVLSVMSVMPSQECVTVNKELSARIVISVLPAILDFPPSDADVRLLLCSVVCYGRFHV